MQFYRILDIASSENALAWKGGQADAHNEMKRRRSPFNEMRAELVEVQTDKAGILHLLATGQPLVDLIVKTYRLSPRGGLVECPNGE